MNLRPRECPRLMWRSTLILLGIFVPTGAGAVSAQGSPPAQVRAVAGCWAINVGALSPPRDLIQQDWARRPAMIQVDTVPGRGWSGGPVGWRVRTPDGVEPSRLGNGYLLVRGPDSLEIHWTSGMVGVAITLHVRGARMEGTADAWTDALMSSKASVNLQRTGCPQAGPHRRGLRPGPVESHRLTRAARGRPDRKAPACGDPDLERVRGDRQGR
jgi:hypothetical protein